MLYKIRFSNIFFVKSTETVLQNDTSLNILFILNKIVACGFENSLNKKQLFFEFTAYLNTENAIIYFDLWV